jgi:hypothetical protein
MLLTVAEFESREELTHCNEPSHGHWSSRANDNDVPAGDTYEVRTPADQVRQGRDLHAPLDLANRQAQYLRKQESLFPRLLITVVKFSRQLQRK